MAFEFTYRSFGKRLLDLLLVIPGLILLSPVLAVLALLVRVTMGSPVIFRQKRPGLHGKPFTLYKFRTMTNERDEKGNLLPDAKRLTPLGKFLRKYSLDELPELWNVLKGDMSLVGPRPLLMRYLPRYTPEQMRRHEVKPGVTGWAQIHERNLLPWEERFKLDVWYVDNLSLCLDLKILASTFKVVFSSEKVLPEGGSAYAEYWGVNGPPSDGPLAYPVEEDESSDGLPST